MNIGTNTLQMATLDAKFVKNITTNIIISSITIFGRLFRFDSTSPIFSFSPDFFAASDNAKPPPVKICSYSIITYFV